MTSGKAGSPEPASIPLAQLLHLTAERVGGVMQGESTTRLLATVPAACRPGVQALLLTVLRHWGVAQLAVERLVPRAPKREVKALLVTALALLNAQPAPYAPHTLVSQAVQAAKRSERTRHSAGLINACLREWLRQAEVWLPAWQDQPAVTANVPDWWWTRLVQDHGPARALQVVQHQRAAAPLSLRVNARWGDAQRLVEQWAPHGIDAWITGSHSVQLHRPLPVHQLPGFAQGWCSVQDWAAQQAAPLLLAGLRPSGERLRLLDACAAPGGKTAHLLELADAQVVALEKDPVRAQRIHETLDRLQLQAEVRVADAGEPPTWWTGEAFDGILLDAPCTASGIVRRHPDVPWLRRATDIDGLRQQQHRLLDALWPLLRPGGVLVYCTCSVFKAEGEAQIDAFVQRHTGVEPEAAPGHLLPRDASQVVDLGDNEARDHDGFFYARLRKAD